MKTVKKGSVLRLKRVTGDTVLRTSLAVLKAAIANFRATQASQIASSLAYTTLLSLVPLLAVSFTIFYAFGGLERLATVLEPLVLETLSEGTGSQVLETLKSSLSNIRTGVLGVGGFIGLIITCMSMLASVERAVNRIWGGAPPRKWFHRLSNYWLFITLGPLGAAIVLGAASSQIAGVPLWIPRGTIAFVLTWISCAILNKAVPTRKVRWLPAAVGGGFTAIGLGLARIGFGLYTSQVLTYHKIYGSLGAVPLFLLWIFILWLVILMGVCISSSTQDHLYDARSPSPSNLS